MIDRFIKSTYDFFDSRGINPMVAVLPFVIVTWLVVTFGLKALFWLLTYGL